MIPGSRRNHAWARRRFGRRPFFCFRAATNDWETTFLRCDEWMGELLSRGLLLAAEPARESPFPSMILFTVLGIVFLYMFIVQRPAMKKEQETRQNMLRNLKKNDRVLTTGGIYGVVTNVQADSDEITLRVDEATGAKIKVVPSAIQRVIGDDAGGKENPKDSK